MLVVIYLLYCVYVNKREKINKEMCIMEKYYKFREICLRKYMFWGFYFILVIFNKNIKLINMYFVLIFCLLVLISVISDWKFSGLNY